MTIQITVGNQIVPYARAVSPVMLNFPENPRQPIDIVVSGYPRFSVTLPYKEQLHKRENTFGSGYIYRAHNWCILAENILATLDFGCDMNKPINPMVEPKLGWPPQKLIFAFTMAKGWYLNLIDAGLYADQGKIVPISGLVGDLVGIFTSRAHNIIVIQAFARCDNRAFYHLQIDHNKVILDQKLISVNCQPRFPPVLEL